MMPPATHRQLEARHQYVIKYAEKGAQEDLSIWRLGLAQPKAGGVTLHKALQVLHQ